MSKPIENSGPIYGVPFFEGIQQGSANSAASVVPLLLSLIRFDSVVDVGCGIGSWLIAFADKGIKDYLGLDGDYVNRDQLMIPRHLFRSMDLSRPEPVGRTFDLAISMEVAEHLPRIAATGFVKFLTELAPVILFSAAIPGQGGTHHVNEQWPWHWRDLFAGRGYVRVDPIRPAIWNNPNVEFWYRQNTVLFVREADLPNYPRLLELYSQIPSATIEPVAEYILRSAVAEPSVRTLLRQLPGSIRRAIRRRLFPKRMST